MATAVVMKLLASLVGRGSWIMTLRFGLYWNEIDKFVFLCLPNFFCHNTCNV